MQTSRSISIFSLVFLLSLLFAALTCKADNGDYANPNRRVISSASELDYPPFALVRGDGTADGFAVDLLKAVASVMGLEVSFKVGPWHTLKAELADGKIDVLPLVAYSGERDKVFDFTAPYLRMHGTIFVRKGETSIRNETDLKGKEVLVMRDDMAHEYAVRKQLTDKLILTDSFEAAMQDLSSGKHDAVIVQHLVGLQLIKKLGISNVQSIRSFHASSLKPATEPLTEFEQKICIAVKEGDKELLARLNEGLALVVTNRIYDDLYDKWFGPILPQPAVSPARIFKYLLFILLPLLALIGISSAWFLKREVARKTNTIKQNEERLKRSQEISHLGSWEFDLEKDQLNWSDEVYRIFGLQPQQFIATYEAFLNFVHPDDRQKVADAYASSLHDDRDHYELEHRIIRPDGTIRFVHEKCEHHRGSSGKIIRSVGMVHDITDRKQAAEAVIASERKYRELMETANSVIIRWDNQGVIRFVNEFGLRFFGYAATELIGRSVMTIVPEVEKSTGRNLKAWVKDMIAHPERCIDVPNENITKDGRTVWVAWTQKAILDRQGNIKEILVIGNDVTSMKEAEQALQQNERRLSLALSATADAIWEWYLATDETYYSPRWYEMLGYENQAIPMNLDGWKKLCHPDDFQPTMDLIHSRLESSDDLLYSAEFRMRNKNGSWVWILGRGRVVERDQAGKPVLLSGTNTDITERKHAEVALHRLSQFPEENPNPVLRITADGTLLYRNSAALSLLTVLNWRSGEPLPKRLHAAIEPTREQGHAVETEITMPDGRTFSFFAIQPHAEDYINLYGIDLTERKRVENALRDSEERLKASLAEKEVLLKEIHHRVKNNMQVISSLVDLQADEVEDAAMREVFHDVVYRVRSMAMVHEKLYQSNDLAQVEFADYSETLLGYLWRAQGGAESGIILDMDLNPVLLSVNQAVPCGLVLNELFSNALKHAFNGRTSGRVTVSLGEDGLGKVYLEVRDDGIGLPVGFDWKHVSSLGLRLVQMLTRQLNATLQVASDSGTVITTVFERSLT